MDHASASSVQALLVSKGQNHPDDAFQSELLPGHHSSFLQLYGLKVHRTLGLWLFQNKLSHWIHRPGHVQAIFQWLPAVPEYVQSLLG